MRRWNWGWIPPGAGRTPAYAPAAFYRRRLPWAGPGCLTPAALRWQPTGFLGKGGANNPWPSGGAAAPYRPFAPPGRRPAGSGPAVPAAVWRWSPRPPPETP